MEAATAANERAVTVIWKSTRGCENTPGSDPVFYFLTENVPRSAGKVGMKKSTQFWTVLGLHLIEQAIPDEF